jgi:PhnB protein
VKTIPAKINKMPPVTPYLTVKGAADAITFYKKAFGATENARMPAQDGKRLMHADISINGGRILMSDEFPEYGEEHGVVRAPTDSNLAGVAVALHYGKPTDIDATYRRAIEAGCKSVQEPQDMFWEARFAMLSDPYGHRWMMNAPLPAKKPARSDKKKASA